MLDEGTRPAASPTLRGEALTTPPSATSPKGLQTLANSHAAAHICRQVRKNSGLGGNVLGNGRVTASMGESVMSSDYVRIIRISVDRGEAGLLYATSPDLPKLLVDGKTMEGLETEIPAVIEAMYKASGVIVSVCRASAAEDLDSDHKQPWVAIPAAIAAKVAAGAHC